MSAADRLLPDDPSAPLAHRLLLALGIQPEHAVGRHDAVIEAAVRIRSDAHKYPMVVEDWSTVRAERDVLASIVRDLAAAAGFDECVFCPSSTGQVADHDKSCPYRRAREWVDAQDTPPPEGSE